MIQLLMLSKYYLKLFNAVHFFIHQSPKHKHFWEATKLTQTDKDTLDFFALPLIN